jgi:transaldolase
VSTAWLESLRVRIFADGADTAGILELARLPFVAGFTTNPTLMRRAGVADYRAFARDVLAAVPERPVSFEVIADEFDAMARQARAIAGWGPNVFVKIPVTNTRGEPALDLVRLLAREGVRLNVTALMTLEQVRAVADALADGPASFVSVFAGRVADTGRDPVPLMAEAVQVLGPYPQQRLIWASPREVLNVLQADAVGCHVITATSALIQKLPLVGRDLADYSLETVREFQADARKAGYQL